MFSIGQNYSPEAAILFLQLQYFLGGIGVFQIRESSTGKIHLKFRITNSSHILNKVVPYFCYLFGQKFKDINKLYRINNLSQILSKEFNPILATELIHLVYSSNPDAHLREMSLKEKLDQFELYDSIPISTTLIDSNLSVNSQLPSLLFIIGFFLGDELFVLFLIHLHLDILNFILKVILILDKKQNKIIMNFYLL